MPLVAANIAVEHAAIYFDDFPIKPVQSSQWEFQDPTMEVLYHIRPYFVWIFPYIGLKHRPYIW